MKFKSQNNYDSTDITQELINDSQHFLAIQMIFEIFNNNAITINFGKSPQIFITLLKKTNTDEYHN